MSEDTRIGESLAKRALLLPHIIQLSSLYTFPNFFPKKHSNVNSKGYPRPNSKGPYPIVGGPESCAPSTRPYTPNYPAQVQIPLDIHVLDMGNPNYPTHGVDPMPIMIEPSNCGPRPLIPYTMPEVAMPVPSRGCDMPIPSNNHGGVSFFNQKLFFFFFFKLFSSFFSAWKLNFN